MIVSLFRDYDNQRKRVTFGAVLLVQDTRTPDILVVRWLCKDVTEQEAREAIEAWQNQAS